MCYCHSSTLRSEDDLSMRARPPFRRGTVLRKRSHFPFLRSFLRSVGLKILALWGRFSGFDVRDGKENEQVVVSESQKLALSHIAVHALPIFITLFVFCMNGIEILNGPQIPITSAFFLQVAAKFHELTIAGSLTAVVLDIIRYELLHEGLNLGLLVSGFSVTAVSFLWSPEMLSMFKANYTNARKFWLFSTLTICCALLAVVGPSSALLFIPVQVWRPYGEAEFYLGSTSGDLWPDQLTAQDTGPAWCNYANSTSTTICPAGGYDMVAARLTKDVQTFYTIFLQDAHFTRVIEGWTPRYNYSSETQKTQESWVISSRGDVTFLMQDLGNPHFDAMQVAKGRHRRLRDFVDGSYMIAESKIPVGRTVCGPAITIQDNTRTIGLPVLTGDRKWRNISFGSNQLWGPLIDHEIEDVFQTTSIRAGPEVSAKWIALGPEHGAATAGVIVVARNATIAVGRGCTLDYRWAQGQTYHGSGSSSAAFFSHVGLANTPSDSQNTYSAPGYQDFLQQEAIKSSDTIKADQDWLDAAFPIADLSDRPDGHNMTTYEAMIERTQAQDPSLILSDDPEQAYRGLAILEYATGVAFVDVLARTNWYKSLKYADNSMTINPLLQQAKSDWRNHILTDGKVYNKPDNISTTTMCLSWYVYGTAWTLHEPGQFVAVGVLSLYMLVALMHSIVALVRGTSMEAWDSILELVLLAWNSTPTRRDGELKNASVGMHKLKTAMRKVKIVVVEDEVEKKMNTNEIDNAQSDVAAGDGADGNDNNDSTNPNVSSDDSGDDDDSDNDGNGNFRGRVELILLDDSANNADGRTIREILPGKTYG